MKLRNLILMLAALAVFSGCHAEDKTVLKNPVVATPVLSYPMGSALMGALNNQVFLNNKLFLWKDPLLPSVAEAVLRAGEKIDRSEDKVVVVKGELQKIDSDLAASTEALNKAAQALDQSVRDSLETMNQLQNERSQLSSSPDDQARAAEIDAQLGDLNTKLKGVLPAGVQTAKAARDALYAKKTERFQYWQQLGKEGDDLVNQVMASTDYFEGMRDGRFVFDFGNSGVSVKIEGFPGKNDVQSTALGTVHDVTYQEAGGVLRFDVYTAWSKYKDRDGNWQTRVQEYFKFRVSRARPEVTDGRMFYFGDMDRYSWSEFKQDYVVRHGIAKLATSN